MGIDRMSPNLMAKVNAQCVHCSESTVRLKRAQSVTTGSVFPADAPVFQGRCARSDGAAQSDSRQPRPWSGLIWI